MPCSAIVKSIDDCNSMGSFRMNKAIKCIESNVIPTRARNNGAPNEEAALSDREAPSSDSQRVYDLNFYGGYVAGLTGAPNNNSQPGNRKMHKSLSWLEGWLEGSKQAELQRSQLQMLLQEQH